MDEITVETILVACIAGAGRSYECPLCDMLIGELYAMRSHLEHHYPRDSPTCPVTCCAKAFSHPNSIDTKHCLCVVNRAECAGEHLMLGGRLGSDCLVQTIHTPADSASTPALWLP
uniref:C2H2-type domain-containing protein n=1 Tax=Timema tahoe TaxID=61484 RepID=A0A7R9IBR8_9NEOP|nr:unnamed protein product [Timema tahoe]